MRWRLPVPAHALIGEGFPCFRGSEIDYDAGAGFSDLLRSNLPEWFGSFDVRGLGCKPLVCGEVRSLASDVKGETPVSWGRDCRCGPGGG